MKKLFLLSAMLCCATFFSADAQWAAKQNMTTPSGSSGISAVQCFSLNGKIYAGGGYYAMFTNTNDFHMYDPVTNAWTPKGDLPGAADRSGGIAFSVNGKGYIGLGAMGWSSLSYTYLSDLWMYDPVTNLWTQKASLPDSGRHEPGYFVVNNKVYVVGGSVQGSTSNDVWEYDPATDAWTDKGTYPLGKINSPFSWSSATKGYISCGATSPGYTSATYEYTPTTNAWVLRDTFPGGACSDGVAFVLTNKGYCGLNRKGNTTSTYDTTFYAYDMTTNTWGAAIPFPHGGRANAMATTVNSKAYVGTGWKPASSTVYFKDWYEYPTTTGIESIENDKVSYAYPNPSNGSFSISAEGAAEYQLLNLAGQIVSSGKVPQDKMIHTEELPDGLYILKVRTATNTGTQMLQIRK